MSDVGAVRSSHSIMSAVHDAIFRWYALLGGIAAWTIHLLVLAAIVRLTCNAHRYTIVMHLATAVTLLMTAAALALSVKVLRSGSRDDTSDAEGGRQRFFGPLRPIQIIERGSNIVGRNGVAFAAVLDGEMQAFMERIGIPKQEPVAARAGDGFLVLQATRERQ